MEEIIVINAVTARYGGQEVVLKHFLNFAKKQANYNFIFFVNHNFDFWKWSEYSNIQLIPIKNDSFVSRLKWDIYELNKRVKSLNNKVIYAISLQNTGFYLKNVKKGVLLHNIIPFQDKRWSLFNKEERRFWFLRSIYKKFQKMSIKNNTEIFVQTEHMRNVLKNDFPKNAILLINHNDQDIDLIKSEFKNKDKQVIYFYPSDDYSYKNHKMLIDAVSIILGKGIIPNFKVIFTLSEDSWVFKYCSDKKVGDYFNFIGRIDNAKVLQLYNETTLIFLSEMESLGLPIVEAKSFHCNIITFATPYALELLGDYSTCKFLAYDKNDYDFNVRQVISAIMKVEKKVIPFIPTILN
ncbi:glycosyltransferase [Metabacillus idriensis]|uniref:glycosyltransferase n=1 Tax=Metabacillus idriensis TaxID=324768 RepID=UPI003D2B9739